MLLPVVTALVLVALSFDFVNGFHDAASSIATVVSTRALSPLVAVAWAAFFNFVSAAPVPWGAELRVAATMGKGIVEFPALQARAPAFVLVFIFAALVGGRGQGRRADSCGPAGACGVGWPRGLHPRSGSPQAPVPRRRSAPARPFR
jgi:hypothetical protein